MERLREDDTDEMRCLLRKTRTDVEEMRQRGRLGTDNNTRVEPADVTDNNQVRQGRRQLHHT